MYPLLGTSLGLYPVAPQPNIELRHHPLAEKELKSLIDGRGEERRQAAIIIDELRDLKQCIEAGRRHRKEDSLSGISGVRYLRLKTSNNSIRVYFTVDRGSIWVLHVEPGKRRTRMTDGAITKIEQRRAWALKQIP